jgi:hypothetical protein
MTVERRKYTKDSIRVSSVKLLIIRPLGEQTNFFYNDDYEFKKKFRGSSRFDKCMA